MSKRVFNADEINRLLNSLAGDDPYDLGGGLTAMKTARGLSPLDKDKSPGFRIDKNGKWGDLVEDSSPEILAAISAALWEKGKEFFSDDVADLLTPDYLKDEPQDDNMTPLELRDKPDSENLEPDPTGLTPDSLRSIIADPALAKRLATGTATAEERLSDLLTPDDLK